MEMMMSFFTVAGMARRTLLAGNFEMWRVLLILKGRSLQPADQLAAAAASRKAATLVKIREIYADVLGDQNVLQTALEGAISGDNLRNFQIIMGLFEKAERCCDTDRALAVAAKHGSDVCWDYMFQRLGWRATAQELDHLVDCALEGRSGAILDCLVTKGELPKNFRMRILNALKLRAAVRARNVSAVRDIVQHAQFLKPQDYREAELFARKGYGRYFLAEIVHSAMDNALAEKTMQERKAKAVSLVQTRAA